MAEDNKKTTTGIGDFADQLTKLVEIADKHKFVGSMFAITLIMVIAETLFPKSTNIYVNAFYAYLENLSKNIAEFSTEKWNEAKSELRRITDEFNEYIDRNRWVWLTLIAIYVLLTATLLMYGYKHESNWPFSIGAAMVIVPIFIVGSVKKTIGRMLSKNSEGKVNWTASGRRHSQISLLLFLLAFEWVTIHTIWFVLIFGICLAILFIASGLMKKSIDPLASTLKLVSVFCGITIIGVVWYIATCKFETLHDFHESHIAQIVAKARLSAVERFDNAEVIQDKATETEKTPWREAQIDMVLYSATYPHNGVVIENEFSISDTIAKGTPIQVIKDEKITDKAGAIWVHVTHNGQEGWLRSYFLKSLSDEDAVKLLASKK